MTHIKCWDELPLLRGNLAVQAVAPPGSLPGNDPRSNIRPSGLETGEIFRSQRARMASTHVPAATITNWHAPAKRLVSALEGLRMSTPEDLQEIYTDELKDLWSANDQMQKVLKKIAGKASDPALKEMLAKSLEGIAKHTDVVKELIAGQDEKVSKEHCKGMEGLVAEATKHVLEEGPKKGPLLDVLIIAQYQRMTHYGIAGFGTAAAYAEALSLKDDSKKLNQATKEIYGGDEYMTKLAETSVNLQAEDA